MPLDPTALANAFVATPNPAGDAPYGPTGYSLTVTHLGVPTFVKFVAQAGMTYTVSTNVVPGDLVVLGPNGGPLNPGTAIKAFEFTPLQTGLYMVEMVANPRFVATGQDIDLSINAFQTTVPTSIPGALMIPTQSQIDQEIGNILGGPTGISGLLSPTGGVISGGTQYFLHSPDGNASGAAMADAAATSSTPLEMANGKPLTWVGSTDAPGMPGAPTQITIAPALYNYQSDQGLVPTLTDPLNAQELNLLHEAANVWESVANIQFNFVTDTSTNPSAEPDIRVGLAALQTNMHPNTMGFIGYTHFHWDANNKFLPDNVSTVEDPAEHPVTALSDGDLQYNGTNTTMLQDMIHEIGHALGLDHNPNDPTSVMNPTIGSSNRMPDAQDIAAIQSLYGAPSQPIAMTPPMATLLGPTVSLLPS